jgi:hypothetical protein
METGMITSTHALASPVRPATNVDQLPIDIQEIISSYLEFKDAFNFYESSPWISRSVLSCSKCPTKDDLQSIQNNTEMFECALQFAKVSKQTLQNFFIEIPSHSRAINQDVINMLFEDSRIDPSEENNYVFRSAYENGNFELVEILLKDSRVDPSAGNNGAFTKACLAGRTEIVETLLNDNRVEASVLAKQGIVLACGHTEIVEMLLKDGRFNPCANNNIAII